MRRGKMIANNVVLEKHEMETVDFLLKLGRDIELLRPSLTPNSKNADLIMDHLIWEMKCPQGASRYCIERRFRKATHQAQNIILDLRLVRIDGRQALSIVHRLFAVNRRVRRMLVIDKDGRVVDFRR